MIRTGQHKRVPRKSIIGDQGWGFLNACLDGVCFAMTLAAIILAAQYWAHLRAFAHGFHMALFLDARDLFHK